MAILLCTNACMYKRINKKKKCNIFNEKGTKIICIIFYLILNYMCLLCCFFSTVKRKGNFDYIIIYLLTLYSATLMVFFVAYGKLCVSVTCVSVSTYFIKPGISERAILSCTLYPDPSFFCLKTDPCVCVRVYVCKCRWPCLLM